MAVSFKNLLHTNILLKFIVSNAHQKMFTVRLNVALNCKILKTQMKDKSTFLCVQMLWSNVLSAQKFSKDQTDIHIVKTNAPKNKQNVNFATNDFLEKILLHIWGNARCHSILVKTVFLPLLWNKRKSTI